MAIGTMALIGLGLAGFGAAQQVRGQLQQGRAAKAEGEANQRAYEAQAEVAESRAGQLEFNARAADLQGADAITRGQEEESRFRTTVRGLVGAQRAGFAGGNVDVNFGSAGDVQRDTVRLGELDAQTIRSNAQREAWGFRTQAEDYRMGAGIARKEAAAARVGGGYAAAAGRAGQSAARTAATTTILGTGSSLLLQRYGWASRERAA